MEDTTSAYEEAVGESSCREMELQKRLEELVSALQEKLEARDFMIQQMTTARQSMQQELDLLKGRPTCSSSPAPPESDQQPSLTVDEFQQDNGRLL